MTLINAFRDGGPFICRNLSIRSFDLRFYHRTLHLFLYAQTKTVSEDFLSGVRQSLSRGDFSQVERWSLQSPSPLSRIVARGCQVMQHGGSEEEVQARMDEELSKAIHKIDKRSGFLSMFGNVATVGLLGTICGMIRYFSQRWLKPTRWTARPCCRKVSPKR